VKQDLSRNYFSSLMACALTFALMLALPSKSFAEIDYSDKDIRQYKVVYLEKKSEDSVKIRSEVEDIVEYTGAIVKGELDGRQVYVMEREEKNDFGDINKWKFYMEPKNMGLLRIEKKTISRSGQTVREQFTKFNDPMFDYPENLYHVFTITAAIRTMQLSVGAKDDIYLLLGEDSAPWHMYILVESEEKVSVPHGDIDCYRIKLEPDYEYIMGKWAWTASIIKRFVPDFHFWVDKEFPHGLVKFQGTFGPVGGSPPQAHELSGVTSP